MKSIYLFVFSTAITFAILISNHEVLGQAADPTAAVALATASPSQASVLVSAPAPVVSVAAPAAPPQWAADLLVAASSLPVIGPVISKAILYAGIVSSILTALVAALLAILTTLSSAFNLAGLASIVAKIEAFKSGQIMYWLSYLSIFNAKKPDPAATAKVAQPSEQKAA